MSSLLFSSGQSDKVSHGIGQTVASAFAGCGFGMEAHETVGLTARYCRLMAKQHTCYLFYDHADVSNAFNSCASKTDFARCQALNPLCVS